jgi:hypothetical protein
MTFRTIALVAVSLLSLAGCSAEASDSSASSTADVTVTKSNVLDRTIVKGTIAMGETSTVAYTGNEYALKQIDGVPYLAWEVNGAGDHLSVEVEGNFPSTPDVLLVDEGGSLLGQAHGTGTALGDKATLEVNATPGKKLILVRDMEWVRPMDFEISVAE